MKPLTRLQIDTKDLKVFGLMSIVALGMWGLTGSPLIALNGVVSYLFTFVPARLERLRKTDMTDNNETLVDFDAERRKSLSFHPEVREGTQSNGTVVQEGQQVVPERVKAPGEISGGSSTE